MPTRRGKLPALRLPKMPGGKAPDHLHLADVRIRVRPVPFAAKLKDQRPAGDPPAWWKVRFPTGTLPEWCVWWGLVRNGKQPDLDFIPQSTLLGAGVSYYSTVDFMLPREQIAIEVQGEFWHYNSSERLFRDRERFQILANRGISLIFIDETDAISRPDYIVREALALRDHSKTAARLF